MLGRQIRGPADLAISRPREEILGGDIPYLKGLSDRMGEIQFELLDVEDGSGGRVVTSTAECAAVVSGGCCIRRRPKDRRDAVAAGDVEGWAWAFFIWRSEVWMQ
jgi:hypothetical protein